MTKKTDTTDYIQGDGEYIGDEAQVIGGKSWLSDNAQVIGGKAKVFGKAWPPGGAEIGDYSGLSGRIEDNIED